eukprot:9276405-Pyramimonas_sp.AAC.1
MKGKWKRMNEGAEETTRTANQVVPVDACRNTTQRKRTSAPQLMRAEARPRGSARVRPSGS